MDCEQALEAISAALDGELSQAEQAALSEHLLRCEECRALAEDMRSLSAMLEASDQAPPPELSRSVMEAVAGEKKARTRPGFPRWLPSVAAVFALCICLGGVKLWLSNGVRADSNLSGGIAPAAAPAPSAMPHEPALYSSESAENSLNGCVSDGFDRQATEDEFVESPAEPGAPPPASVEPAPSAAAGDPETWKDTVMGYNPYIPGQSAEGDGSVSPEELPPPEPDFYWFQNEQVMRVTWGMTPSSPSAHVLGSVQSLEEFAAQFPEDDLSQLLESYDSGYFSTNRLLAVVVEEGSGSVTHHIGFQGLYWDKVKIVRRVPEIGTDDMAAWLILAEVDSSFEDGDVLNVVFETEAAG